MNRLNQLIVVTAICLLCCALAGAAALVAANDSLTQTIGAAVVLFSLGGLICAVLAQRQKPEQETVNVPVKASLGRFLDGLEGLLAGDVNTAIPMPEQISSSERERLETATASLRSLVQKYRSQRQSTASEQPAVATSTENNGTGNSLAVQEQAKHLSKLSQRLEQLASQLLASTGANEENREGAQEQLATLKLQARKLSDRSRMLGDNIDLLKDLAEQSGVLALNAAIQASRSGEDGLGIIADELQRVANRHSDAGRQFEENLQQLNADLTDTNKIIDTGRQHLNQGQHDVSQLRRHISELARTCNALRNQTLSA
ncbi:MAG: methyl-accepting chemotaxis protein [Gammaproteobacteria bacterium]|nr:methyl-accepting chemotaxis protein [Gammaproteobacteria bacterium]